MRWALEWAPLRCRRLPGGRQSGRQRGGRIVAAGARESPCGHPREPAGSRGNPQESMEARVGVHVVARESPLEPG